MYTKKTIFLFAIFSLMLSSVQAQGEICGYYKSSSYYGIGLQIYENDSFYVTQSGGLIFCKIEGKMQEVEGKDIFIYEQNSVFKFYKNLKNSDNSIRIIFTAEDSIPISGVLLTTNLGDTLKSNMEGEIIIPYQKELLKITMSYMGMNRTVEYIKPFVNWNHRITVEPSYCGGFNIEMIKFNKKKKCLLIRVWHDSRSYKCKLKKVKRNK
jgi:hypothetical protein